MRLMSLQQYDMNLLTMLCVTTRIIGSWIICVSDDHFLITIIA